MRYPTPRLNPVRSKVVIYTGGVKEDISQLEMKPGELIAGLNYQEVDGRYHGYASMMGYESYDGRTLASEVDLVGITDYGDDTRAALILQSNNEAPSDASTYGHTVSDNGIIHDLLLKEFLDSSFYFNGSSLQVTPVDDTLDLGMDPNSDPPYSEVQDWTIEMRIRPTAVTGVQVLLERAGAYKVELNNNQVQFSYSTDGVSWTDSVVFTNTVSAGEWQHISIIRKGSTILCAIEGTRDLTELTAGTEIPFDSGNDIYIGSSFVGHMDEIRISLTYRWIFDFDVSERHFTDPRYYFQQWDDEAREAQRALITEVPGEGSILAVAVGKAPDGTTQVGACRNAVGGATSEWYRSTETGWSGPIPGAWYVEFSGGRAVSGWTEGETVNFTNGASGVVLYHDLHSGSWVTNSAAGHLVITNVTGTITDGDTITGATSGEVATLVAGTQKEYKMAPDGDYELISARFDEFDGLQRLDVPFFVNGVNVPGYWDGTQVIPIFHHNLPDDTGTYATHIADFKNRLWLAYPDGRLWYSSVGNPLEWDTATEGAGVIYMEDEISELIVAPGDVLLVICRNSVQMIKSIADSTSSTGGQADYAFFNETFSKVSGGLPHTAERMMGDVHYCDDRGFVTMSSTDTYGDFNINTLSKNVQDTYTRNRNLIVGATIDKESNQYRLFYSDKTGIIFTFNSEKKVKGATFFKYLHEPTYVDGSEDDDGNNVMYMGCTDGFVYKLDSGTSFDGEPIETKLQTSFNAYGSPTNWKRFHKITLEAQADKGLVFVGKPEYNYRDSRIPRESTQEYVSTGFGGIWGQVAWGEFTWGSSIVQSPSLYLNGYGNNMSMIITTNDKYARQHILNNMIVEYSLNARKM